MCIINKMIQRGHPLNRGLTCVQCDMFEDNQGTIEMATVSKIHPWTQHINLAYYHFKSLIGKFISVHYIESQKEWANIMTKSMQLPNLHKFHHYIMGHTMVTDT